MPVNADYEYDEDKDNNEVSDMCEDTWQAMSDLLIKRTLVESGHIGNRNWACLAPS